MHGMQEVAGSSPANSTKNAGLVQRKNASLPRKRPRVRIPQPAPNRAGLAQLVEQSPCKRKVVGSKPTAGTRRNRSSGVERRLDKTRVAGSKPAGSTIKTRGRRLDEVSESDREWWQRGYATDCKSVPRRFESGLLLQVSLAQR